jgi:signal peptidase I
VSSEPISPTQAPPVADHLNWRRAAIALLLSILQQGLGQIYNREPTKAIFYFVFFGGFLLLCRVLALWNTFIGFATFLVVLLGSSLFMIVDATRVALRRKTESELARVSRPTLALAFVLAIVLAIGNGSGFIFNRIITIKAFKVPSESMSPTIMFGDRIVADMHAYARTRPHRGDIIVFVGGPTRTLLFKRVAAIEGDTIEGTEQGIVLNGRLVSEPYRAPLDPNDDTSWNEFGPTRVPPGEFYVLGDNRQKSFDSRIPSFGGVKLDPSRGKALFTYWATDRTRIGKQIQ